MDTAVIKTPTVPGTPYAGGFYAGRINIEGEQYAIIVAPKSTELETIWGSASRQTNAKSFFDGAANTQAMVESGSDLAKYMQSLDNNGFNDWYLPSRDELEICYRNLKPTANENYCWRGDNPSSVPPGYAYTRDLPAQTSAPTFQDDGAEAFEPVWYWTSTQDAGNPDSAWIQDFGTGNQNHDHELYEYRARAVRRCLVIE